MRSIVENMRRERTYAYTTIMTVMNHLYKKGFLQREKVNKTYYYEPCASESQVIRVSIRHGLKSLLSEYGGLAVLSMLLPVEVNLSLPRPGPMLASYKTPVTIGFFVSMALGLFTLFSWELLQGTTVYSLLAYLGLLVSEPQIVFGYTDLILRAFFESLPTSLLLTNLVLLISSVILIRKIVSLIDLKFPSVFYKSGGLIR
ncbi:MAG: BlaI family transcriptional regulator [Microgenomates group bacterium GW2011_GWA2_44_7]|nr:MAG: BlaI family transcriptional regulator [Microgenomates group bacterium GW2011_GWA2_44_7]KKT77870.1 MAG: BlaI family transcriptional regulator [Microgenomates group bacterium GW2011_GWB1_44_8]